MAIPSNRRDLTRLFWRRAGLLALFVAVAMAASSVWGVYKKERESRVLREQAEREAQDLTVQQNELSTHIAKLQTERGKEEALRAQYAVGKQGEGLIIIVDPEAPQPIQATSTIMKWVHKFLPFW